MTHVLNTAERHVPVNPAKYPLHGISYFGFHVDDHPMSNLSRFFGRTTDFIEEAMNRSGLIGKVENVLMGGSLVSIPSPFIFGENSNYGRESLREV